MTDFEPGTPMTPRNRAAHLLVRVLREVALFAGTLLLMWALFAYVLPRFGINT